MDLEDFFEPAVPRVEACRDVTSWWTESLELMEPERMGRLRLLARFTMVATVRQNSALARASRVQLD